MFEAAGFIETRLYELWRDHWTPHILWEDSGGIGGGLPTGLYIGEIADQRIQIQIRWVRLQGHLVGFYWPVSNAVDYARIRRFVERNFCPYSQARERRCHSDLSMFENGLDELGIRLKGD